MDALHLGAAAAGSSTKQRSWALGDDAAAAESGRKLRGCPDPLPDAAKCGLSLDLGMTKEGQGLDRTVARFVTYHEGGAAATGGVPGATLGVAYGAGAASQPYPWPHAAAGG